MMTTLFASISHRIVNVRRPHSFWMEQGKLIIKKNVPLLPSRKLKNDAIVNMPSITDDFDGWKKF